MTSTDIILGGDKRALDRPAWTQDDLNSFQHKHYIIHGRFQKILNYFTKTKGKEWNTLQKSASSIFPVHSSTY